MMVVLISCLRSFTGKNLGRIIFKTSVLSERNYLWELKTSIVSKNVAAYILVRQPQSCEAMKTQKLCYYAQAWYLARYGVPLFAHDFEAWWSGPVSPSLYKYHAGMIDFPADKLLQLAEPDALLQEDQVFVDKVLTVYGRYTGLQLQWMAQAQDPWKNTREAYMAGKMGDRRVCEQCIIDYYSKFLHTQ